METDKTQETILYFKCSGYTEADLLKLRCVTTKEYSPEVSSKINFLEAKLQSMAKTFKGFRLNNTDEKIKQATINKFTTLSMELSDLKSKERATGRDVRLVECKSTNKKGWLAYKVSDRMTDEEIKYIRKFIKSTLNLSKLETEIVYHTNNKLEQAQLMI